MNDACKVIRHKSSYHNNWKKCKYFTELKLLHEVRAWTSNEVPWSIKYLPPWKNGGNEARENQRWAHQLMDRSQEVPQNLKFSLTHTPSHNQYSGKPQSNLGLAVVLRSQLAQHSIRYVRFYYRLLFFSHSQIQLWHLIIPPRIIGSFFYLLSLNSAFLYESCSLGFIFHFFNIHYFFFGKQFVPVFISVLNLGFLCILVH